MKNQKGFTLIELMIVVAIIAILAAIAISQYQDYVIRSQVSEGSSLADGTKTAIAEFYNSTGHFPSTNASAGLAAAASITGSYVSGVDVGTNLGQIVATFSKDAPQKANEMLDTQTRIFSAVTSAGSITWNCNKSGGMEDKWVPQLCRD